MSAGKFVSEKQAELEFNLSPKLKMMKRDESYSHTSNDIHAMKLFGEEVEEFQMNGEEAIWSVVAHIRYMVDEMKLEFEKDRQCFLSSLQRIFGECENSFRSATAKFHELSEKFCKDNAFHLHAHPQPLNDAFTIFKEEKERLSVQYEQASQEVETTINAFAGKVDQLEESLKRENKNKDILLQMQHGKDVHTLI